MATASEGKSVPRALPLAASQPELERSLGAWAAGFPGLVAVLDGELRVLFANAGLGTPAPRQGEALRPFLDLVAPSHRAMAIAALRNAITPGLAHTLELPISASGGERTWWLASVSPWRSGGPTLDPVTSDRPAVLVTALDVSVRHREEERLRHAETLMVDTEGITHLGTWYWDVTQPHAQWSAELFRIYGLDPAHHVPTYQDYLTRVHPDDVERVKAATEAVFRDHLSYSHDERIRRSDGAWRHLHTWARPIKDQDGKLVALAGVCQDITDHKEAEAAHLAAEARFRALFERSEAGLALLDPQGQVLEANAALAAMAGAAGDVRGRGVADLVQPSDRAAVIDAVARAAAGTPARCQVRLLQHGGAAPTRLDVVHVAPGAGLPPFLLAMAAPAAGEPGAGDKLALARLQEIRSLEEAGVRRNRLLRVASHELKNPLTPVVFQLHMLQNRMLGPLNDRQGRAVDVASRQVARISHLLRDVLDVARIEEGHLAIRPVPLEVGELARRVAEAYADPAAEWQVRLEVKGGPECWVDADPERLEQALANLVSNALKFTPRGGQVTMAWLERDDKVLLQVADTGPGFTAAQRDQLFKAFSQVHDPRQAREEGTGLGLYISKHLVARMGGRIDAEGVPGRGATFTITLPARRQGLVPARPADP